MERKISNFRKLMLFFQDKPEIDYLIIFLISLHVLSWFETGYINFGGDVTLPRLSSMLYSWFNLVDGGYPFISFIWIIWNGFFELFRFLGLENAYKIYYVLMTFLSGISMYYLTSTILNYPKERLACFIAAFVYIFNPFVFTIYTTFYVYAVLPLILGLYIKGLQSNKVKYAFFLSLISSFLFFGFPNMTFPLITIFLLIIFTPFYFKKENFKFIFLAVILFFFINLWWIFPSLYNLFTFYTPLESIREVSIPSFSFDITSAFRWLGVWAFEAFDTSGIYHGKPYYPYIEFFQTNPLMIFITFIPALLAFSALILKPKNKIVIIFSILTLISLFLSKGPNLPFGQIYEWLLQNISFFKFFRDTNRFMSIVTLGYSFLIAITSTSIFYRLRNHFKFNYHNIFAHLVLFSIVLVILINSWPLLTGDVITNWYSPSHRGVKIPQFYFDANKWLENQQDYFRIFVLPKSEGYTANKWGYQGANILSMISSKPLIIGSVWGGTYITPSENPRVIDIKQVYNDFQENKSETFGKILGLLNTKYIVVDTSIDTEFYNLPHINNTIDLLNSQDGIEQIKQFGDLLYYENKYYLPHIYASSNVKFFSGTESSPFGIGWLGNMYDGIEINTNISTSDNATYLVTNANGSYISVAVEKNILIDPKQYKYLLIDFKVNEHSDIMVQLNTPNTSFFLLATNPPQYDPNIPPNIGLNRYRSTDWYTLIFKTSDEIKEPITSIALFLTNNIETSYMGKLELWIKNVTFAQSIGFIEGEEFTPSDDSILIFAKQLSQEQQNTIQNILNNHKIPYKPKINFEIINPTSYIVHVESEQPYFLVLGENYNSEWKAYIKGKEVKNHFTANGYANVWYINETGNYDVVMEFIPQKIFEISILVSSISFLMTIYLMFVRRKKK